MGEVVRAQRVADFQHQAAVEQFLQGRQPLQLSHLRHLAQPLKTARPADDGSGQQQGSGRLGHMVQPVQDHLAHPGRYRQPPLTLDVLPGGEDVKIGPVLPLLPGQDPLLDQHVQQRFHKEGHAPGLRLQPGAKFRNNGLLIQVITAPLASQDAH